MTDFNLMRIPSLDTWRDNLNKLLIDALPKDTSVEFVAVSCPALGEIRRFIRIHLADRQVEIPLKFPEPLHIIMGRVAEAIQ